MKPKARNLKTAKQVKPKATAKVAPVVTAKTEAKKTSRVRILLNKPGKAIARAKATAQNRLPKRVTNVIAGITRRVNTLVIIWLVLLACAAVLYRFNANVGDTFATSNVIELQFDHNPKLAEVQDKFNQTNVDVVSSEVLGGNTLIIHTKAKSDAANNLFNALADNKSILNKSGFALIAYKPSTIYFASLIGVSIACTILALAIFVIAFRKRTLLERIRLWSVFISGILLQFIFLAALGVLLSKTPLLKLTPDTLNLFVVLNTALICTQIYIFCKPELRTAYLKLLRLQAE